MTELNLYRYLCAEKMVGAPSSRLMGVIQPMAFCRHVLDMPETQALLDSKRCAGAAKELDPKERKQASHSVCRSFCNCMQWSTLGKTIGIQFLLELRCYVVTAEGVTLRSESAFLDLDDKGIPTFLETRQA